jgi:hypothetical protein
MKFSFQVETTISLYTEVEAESLEEAVELAKKNGVQGLCHQCARGDPDCWNTTGELDCDPITCKLVDVQQDGESVELATVEELWA